MPIDHGVHDSGGWENRQDHAFTYTITWLGDGATSTYTFNMNDYMPGFGSSFGDYISFTDLVGIPNVTIVEDGTTVSMPFQYDVTDPGGNSDPGEYNVHFESAIPDGGEVEMRFEIPVHSEMIGLTQGIV